MPDTITPMRQKLQNCNLNALFIEDLGWDHHRTAPLVVQNDGINYVLNAIAEKHGMVAYECQTDPKGQIPDYPTRGKIERQVAKSAHEHIVVFINHDKTMQIWQWVRREKGKPTARREHIYVCAQPGDSLIQKLQNLMISLEEEEKLTIVDVTGKVRQAFDIDRVTKRFYDRFKEEHKTFLTFIDGIDLVTNREWYASLMLNRLMFIYFIQKKGFLDSDIDYLRNRLHTVRQSQGRGKFHTFYRYFLRRLFHEGLAQRKEDRKEELNTLLGDVPYLNGGLFDTHQLENDNPDIQIPDEAFERLFDFFDAYQWHLDERPTRADNEINPDVLGYIFEKYINQKQMGAYYTKEDITEYISKSTIVPFLFDAAEKKCAIAFRQGGAVWRLLRDDPDRYIYDAVKKGVDLQLPEDIAIGVADVSKRGGWNRPADEVFALPTETWREHVARRTRCNEIRVKMASGEMHSINDLVTFNLDLRQFAQDVIDNCEGPDLLRAFYESIAEVSVLDPTCGSGAFLFIALNILETLYEACLERMEVFVEELDKSGENHHPEKFSDFRNMMEQVNDRAKHPSRRYFILKSIILKNLYGVDIMAEAVEICKLRLFLKLVAQLEQVKDIEPLPDIDFNIRAGNTLVGFTSLESVRSAITMLPDGRYRMIMPEDETALKRIDASAESAEKAFRRFREQQTDNDVLASQYSATKNELQTRLAALRTELDRYLATEYGIDFKKSSDFEKWRASHQPFHWFVEYYGIIQNGGFDVIIGNPPYVEYTKIKPQYTIRGYKTIDCGNIYANILERAAAVSCSHIIGVIVPISAIASSDRMTALRNLLFCKGGHFSSYAGDTNPGILFEGVKRQLSILLLNASEQIYFTKYYRWYASERELLFQGLCYQLVDNTLFDKTYPKVSCNLSSEIISKIARRATGVVIGKNYPERFYFHRAFIYWLKAFSFKPYFFNERDKSDISTNQMKIGGVNNKNDLLKVVAIINSTTYYLYTLCYSDCRNIRIDDVSEFHYGLNDMDALISEGLVKASGQYTSDIIRHSVRKTIESENTGKVIYDEFYIKLSKPTIDRIDNLLSIHYGFSPEEADFIINYDIKYRVGRGNGDSEEDVSGD